MKQIDPIDLSNGTIMRDTYEVVRLGRMSGAEDELRKHLHR